METIETGWFKTKQDLDEVWKQMKFVKSLKTECDWMINILTWTRRNHFLFSTDTTQT